MRPRPGASTQPAVAHQQTHLKAILRATKVDSVDLDRYETWLQLIGPQFGENGLFRIGHGLEGAIEFDTVPERLR